MMNENKPLEGMSNEQIDQLYNTLIENVPEAINKQRDIVAGSVINQDAPIESETINTNVDSFVQLNEQGLLETDMSIFDIAEGAVEEFNEESFKATAQTQASSMFDLDEEEGVKFLEVLLAYRDNKDYPVYRNLPEKIQKMIQHMMQKDNISLSNANMMAELFIGEFISETSMDQAFVDFQKSMDEALSLPSMTDMYSEHMDQVMNDKIPEVAQTMIDEGQPDRAKLLLTIKSTYDSIYTMDALKECYMSTARARKSVKKKYQKYLDFCDELNMRNDKSKFKMDDARNMYTALEKVFIVDAEKNGVTYDNIDIMKVIVLFCESCMNKDPEDVVDASYMYYGMKNIIYLEYTREGKTDFTVQLINNLKNLIEFIKVEEDKRNVSDDSASQRKPKRSVKSRNRSI